MLHSCRATPDVVKDLMESGYVPSWCTACYRKGRTGEHFMKIAKAGNIHSFCHPNSILSLQVSGTGVASFSPERSSLQARVQAVNRSCLLLLTFYPLIPMPCKGVSEGLWHPRDAENRGRPHRQGV